MNVGTRLFNPTVLLALAMLAVITMMILPMPAFMLDVGLAASFALAILIFTVVLFIERPLDFSSFPTVLLASLMLRLSLNVSSTKLIIAEGHSGTDAAGEVIEGFAMFIMQGSLFIGLVVFCVLLIVNFMVITKGAARMAEVGARFALDGMPGKQLAIDSDVAAGAIDHGEAKARRDTEQAETTFFGSLDGASKFVKGDAIAGLLITVLNLVMGVVIGAVVHGMPIGRAFETYAILTVGDGLVTQIPAVIISIASALLLARGGTTGSTDMALVGQLGRHPGAVGTVGLLMAVFAIMPGLPLLPFLAAAALLLGLAAASLARQSKPAPPEDTPVEGQRAPSIGDVLDLDEIHVEFAPDLVSMVLDPATGLDARIANMRTHIATAFGVILPEIRLTDDAALPEGHYRVRIHGVEQAFDRVVPDQVLTLLPDGTDVPLPPGTDVKEPVFGARARWIARDRQDGLAVSGLTVVSPSEVLATHLLEVIKRNLPRLLGLKGLKRLLDEMKNLSDGGRAADNRRLIDDLVPDRVPLDTLLAVLRLLLEERVSIRNLALILETLAQSRSINAQPEALAEHVRQKLGFQILSDLRRGDGSVALIQLAPGWEDVFVSYHADDHGTVVGLPPETMNRLLDAASQEIARASGDGATPAVVTSVKRRRFVRSILNAHGLTNPVLSFEELEGEARLALVGQVAA